MWLLMQGAKKNYPYRIPTTLDLSIAAIAFAEQPLVLQGVYTE